MEKNNTINGRTPEEIKKGLEPCKEANCSACFNEYNCKREAEALALIQQLERERNAAVAEFTEFANSVAICAFCKDFKFDEPCDKGIDGEDCWQWRGVQEV